MLTRVVTDWCFKAAGTTAFMTLFFWGYLSLLHQPLFAVTVMPLTVIDRWVGFQPVFLPFYLSLWLYVSLPPAFLQSRRELLAYGWHVGLLCLLGLLVFLLWPTVIPETRIDWASFPGVSALKTLDAAGNAFPSLHVATAVFSALWLHRQLPEMGAGRGLLLFNAVWCLAIVYSTLAIKQHVFLDVLAGLLLGGGAALWSLRRIPSRSMGDA